MAPGRAWRSSAPGRPGPSPPPACCARAGAVEIDFFERLPTPWGLLRGGVAPDHQEIKRLEDTFDRQTLRAACRFLGNVEVGVDISHAELMRHYTAVVYATGAQTDKSLGIPGEDLPGSWAATEFVGLVQRPPRLPRPRVRPVGPARRGHRQRQRRRRRHPHPHAAATSSSAPTSPTTRSRRCARAAIEEVVVLGRRGPAQAAFTSAELRELGRLDGVDLVVDRAEVELDPVSATVARRGGHVHGAQERRAAARVRRPRAAAGRRAPDRAALPALARSRSAGRPRRGRRRPPQRDRARRRRHAARAARRREVETIECGLVLRSVGYRAVPLPDVPFDERHFVLPNERGRVLDPRRRAAARRLRRRLDQARPDRDPRHEQARRRGDRGRAGRGPARRARCREPAQPGREAHRRAARRAQAGPRHRRRLARDRRAGARARRSAEHRPRVKLASRDELLDAARSGGEDRPRFCCGLLRRLRCRGHEHPPRRRFDRRVGPPRAAHADCHRVTLRAGHFTGS